MHSIHLPTSTVSQSQLTILEAIPGEAELYSLPYFSIFFPEELRELIEPQKNEYAVKLTKKLMDDWLYAGICHRVIFTARHTHLARFHKICSSAGLLVTLTGRQNSFYATLQISRKIFLQIRSSLHFPVYRNKMKMKIYMSQQTLVNIISLQWRRISACKRTACGKIKIADWRLAIMSRTGKFEYFCIISDTMSPILFPGREICFDDLSVNKNHGTYSHLIYLKLHKHTGADFKT